jgi:hypothetical protein
VSGTLGLAGSVDTVITLKWTRAEGTGALSVTGRDVAEMVYPLTFDDGVWNADGTDLADAANKVTERMLSEKMRCPGTGQLPYPDHRCRRHGHPRHHRFDAAPVSSAFRR